MTDDNARIARLEIRIDNHDERLDSHAARLDKMLALTTEVATLSERVNGLRADFGNFRSASQRWMLAILSAIVVLVGALIGAAAVVAGSVH